MKLSLKAARTNANLKQKDIAKQLEVSEATVCRWEMGTFAISLSYLKKYCDLCNIDISNIDTESIKIDNSKESED